MAISDEELIQLFREARGLIENRAASLVCPPASTITEYLDGELEDERALRELRVHLFYCDVCFEAMTCLARALRAEAH